MSDIAAIRIGSLQDLAEDLRQLDMNELHLLAGAFLGEHIRRGGCREGDKCHMLRGWK